MLDALRERTLAIRRSSNPGPAKKDVTHKEYNTGTWKK
jgi:hypothetical protein